MANIFVAILFFVFFAGNATAGPGPGRYGPLIRAADCDTRGPLALVGLTEDTRLLLCPPANGTIMIPGNVSFRPLVCFDR